MKYNFDEYIDRTNNHSAKYDERVKNFGTDDVLPLWIADMDFRVAQPLIDALKARGELDSTLVIYMGDNGFAFGEHGLIDKRTAYEESMRVPLLARCPELFGRGKTVEQMVANLDIMPTVMEAAGLKPPAGLDGASFLPLLTPIERKSAPRGATAGW